MPCKNCRPEEIIAELRQAEVLLGEGKKAPEVVKTLARSCLSGDTQTAGWGAPILERLDGLVSLSANQDPFTRGP